jgi:hypothetical protein
MKRKTLIRAGLVILGIAIVAILPLATIDDPAKCTVCGQPVLGASHSILHNWVFGKDNVFHFRCASKQYQDYLTNRQKELNADFRSGLFDPSDTSQHHYLTQVPEGNKYSPPPEKDDAKQ